MNGVKLKKPLFLSFFLHLFCFMFIFFVHKLPFLEPQTKVIWMELPKGTSEEIDLKIKEAKSLPETTIKEQKEWLKKPEEVKKEKPLVPPKEKPQAKLRPIQQEAKPTHKKKTDVEKALEALAKRKPAPPEAAQVKEKGEGFKYGTGTEPLRVPPTDPEYLAYQAKVRYKIIQEWILPLAYLEGVSPPRARLVVYISENGEITSTGWDARSSNAAFDSSCERAVVRASPLPIPPERLKWEAYNEGFLVEFDPSLKGEQ